MLRAAAALAVLAVAACTAVPRPGALALVHTAPSLESRHSDLLSGAVLHRGDTQTLLEIVAERWPGTVRGELPRGAGLQLGATSPIADTERFGVYDVRGTYLGGPEFLANVRPADVQQLRRLTDVEERARLGRRHAAGAVVIAWTGESKS